MATVEVTNISAQKHSNVTNQLNKCEQGFQLAAPIGKNRGADSDS